MTPSRPDGLETGLTPGAVVFRVVDGEMRRALLVRQRRATWTYRTPGKIDPWDERGQHWWRTPAEALERWIAREIDKAVCTDLHSGFRKLSVRIVATVLAASRQDVQSDRSKWGADRIKRLVARCAEIGHAGIKTRADLARVIGVDPRSVRNWSYGTTHPSSNAIAAILDRIEREVGLA